MLHAHFHFLSETELKKFQEHIFMGVFLLNKCQLMKKMRFVPFVYQYWENKRSFCSDKEYSMGTYSIDVSSLWILIQ